MDSSVAELVLFSTPFCLLERCLFLKILHFSLYRKFCSVVKSVWNYLNFFFV